MKKRKYLILVISAIAILLVILLLYKVINKDTIMINKNNSLWTVYDDNLISIKNNMTEITYDSEEFFWWELSDFSIEDADYQRFLNDLVKDIRMCYLELTDFVNYTEPNIIVEYRNKQKITKKELNNIISKMKNETCISRFYGYSSFLISNNEDRTNNAEMQLNNLKKLHFDSFFSSTNISYDDLLFYKTLQVSYLNNLSNWLKSEYYKLK